MGDKKMLVCEKTNPEKAYLLVVDKNLVKPDLRDVADYDVILAKDGELWANYSRFIKNLINDAAKRYSKDCFEFKHNRSMYVFTITPYDNWDTIFAAPLSYNNYHLVVLMNKLYVVKPSTEDDMYSVHFIYETSFGSSIIEGQIEEGRVETIKDFGLLKSYAHFKTFQYKIFYNQIRDIILGIHNFNMIQWKKADRLFDCIAVKDNKVFFDANHRQNMFEVVENGTLLHTAYVSSSNRKMYDYYEKIDTANISESELLMHLLSLQFLSDEPLETFWKRLGLRGVKTDKGVVLMRERGKSVTIAWFDSINKQFRYKTIYISPNKLPLGLHDVERLVESICHAGVKP